ncbi:MAG: hypothetical protein SaTV8_gp1 [Sanya totivirus 8]|nr:MAG: hypothetical protein SaTV8_gp1 [Sanya totivirus 8]
MESNKDLFVTAATEVPSRMSEDRLHDKREGESNPDETPKNIQVPKGEDQRAVLTMIAWAVNPPQEAGPTHTALTQMPTNCDTASQVGCRSQTYTTWNTLSHAYVSQIRYKKGNKKAKTHVVTASLAAGVQKLPAFDADSREVVESQFSDPKGKDKYTVRAIMAGQQYIYALRKPARGKEPEVPAVVRYTPVGWSPLVGKPNKLKGGGSAVYTEGEAAGGFEIVTAKDAEEELLGPAPDLDLKPPEPPTPAGGYPSNARIGWVPVRRVLVSSARSRSMLGKDPPTTPAFASILERLTNTEASGAMMSMARGVSLRDGASITSLAKYVRYSQDSWKEVAALARCALMNMSMGACCAGVDNTLLQLATDWEGLSFEAQSVATRRADTPYTNVEIRFAACPLDEALAIGLNREAHVAQGLAQRWAYGKLDVTWAMVPVKAETLASPYIRAYLVSFLSTRATFGRVTWRYVYTAQGLYPQEATTVPAANLVELDGPLNLMLVLMDSTRADCPSQITLPGNLVIPVYRGTPGAAAYDGVIVTNYVDAWWQGDGAIVASDCAYAWNELCAALAVDDTCGRALALAGELGLMTRPGKLNAPDERGNEPRQFAGCWQMVPGEDRRWVDGLPYLAEALVETATGAQEEVRRVGERLMGFNAAGLTPWARPVVAAGPVSWAHADAEEQACLVGQPVGMSSHVTTTCSSIMRLAIGVRLVSTHEQGYSMDSGRGLSTFTTMVGTGGALSTAWALAANDISLRSWTGALHPRNCAYGQALEDKIQVWTAGAAHAIDLETIGVGEPDWYTNTHGQIQFYWVGIEGGIGGRNWHSSLGIPAYAVLQWGRKFGVEATLATATYEMTIMNTGESLAGSRLAPPGLGRVGQMCSIDYTRSQPRAWGRVLGFAEGWSPCAMEAWQFVQTDAALPPGWLGRARNLLATNIWLESASESTYVTSDTNRWVLMGTPTITQGGTNALPRTSDIQYPDPPSFGDFLRVGRDWILYPALQAGLGFITGGPVGAAVGAGAGLATAALDEVRRATSAPETRTPEVRKEEPPESTLPPGVWAKEGEGSNPTDTEVHI